MRCRGLIALLIWGQSVAAADLGTWGDLWPVKEPDMLTVIMQRLTALEQSGEMGRKMDAFKERVIRNSLRPPAVPGTGAFCDGVQSQPGSETGRSAAGGDTER